MVRSVTKQSWLCFTMSALLALATASDGDIGRSERDSDRPLLTAGPQGGKLEGTELNEVFLAGQGSDTFTGNGGEDEFVFQGMFPLMHQAMDDPGGYGGSDSITDYESVAGTGDLISLRQLVNGTRVDVLNNPTGNAMIVLSTPYIDPQSGLETGLQTPEFSLVDPASGTLVLPGNMFQSIEVIGVTASSLMNEGRLEINDERLNATRPGVTSNFGTFSYTIGSVNTNIPTRPDGVPGNTFIDFVGGNDLVFGNFITQEAIAAKLQHIAEVLQRIVIPGTEQSDDPELLNQFVIGEIPEALLPRNAFKFALDDLQTFNIDPVNPATINDDTVIGSLGNDFLIGGPGNDVLIGGPGNDILWAGQGQDVVIGVQGVDYIVFDQITDFRDRDDINDDGNALPDARIGYIRLAEGYGIDLTDPLTSQTGPDIILVNSEAFNRGINPDENPELARQIGYLVPGTVITGDSTGPAATKNGQLKVGNVTVPTSDGPADDDFQPTFYWSKDAGRLFFDRDGTGTMFTDFWMADMAIGTVLPEGAPSAAPHIIIVVY
jgi:Ca2+-binding RTX toxin-like protein